MFRGEGAERPSEPDLKGRFTTLGRSSGPLRTSVLKRSWTCANPRRDPLEGPGEGGGGRVSFLLAGAVWGSCGLEDRRGRRPGAERSGALGRPKPAKLARSDLSRTYSACPGLRFAPLLAFGLFGPPISTAPDRPRQQKETQPPPPPQVPPSGSSSILHMSVAAS